MLNLLLYLKIQLTTEAGIFTILLLLIEVKLTFMKQNHNRSIHESSRVRIESKYDINTLYAYSNPTQLEI